VEHLKPGGCIVLNADDPLSWPLKELLKNHTQITFGIDSAADITAHIIDQSLAGTLFELRLPQGTIEVLTPLLGKHNVANCLTASAAACHLGLSLDEIAVGLKSLRAVPGRMEAVECGQLFSVFVDYAHTDDALRRCVRSLRSVTPGRVIVVYGAGGDRDRLKRPLLTQAACDADVAILTSDNPRSEDPEQIIHDCLAGAVAGRAQPQAIVDRETAIHTALDLARPGDSVLIAGKGHETEQITGDERHHFDDREVVRKFLTSISYSTASGRTPESIFSTSS
ncbi:MAG: cyanophycin synthetase, partial [Planctomycetota bacterium]